MTAKELIDILSKFPPNMEVMHHHWDNEYPGYNEEILSVVVTNKRGEDLFGGPVDNAEIIVIM